MMKKAAAIFILSFFITGLPSFAGDNAGKYPLAVKYKKPPRAHFSHHYRHYYRPYHTGCSSIYISNKNGYTIKRYNCFNPYYTYTTPGVTYINFSL